MQEKNHFPESSQHMFTFLHLIPWSHAEHPRGCSKKITNLLKLLQQSIGKCFHVMKSRNIFSFKVFKTELEFKFFSQVLVLTKVAQKLKSVV
jgi:hypothetical protein